MAEDEYLDFALGAPAMLLDPVDGHYLPFGEHWSAGRVRLADWQEHLTTLFPDIRPRGYLEVRCVDAIPAQWYAAPVVLLAGMLYDSASLLAADALLGSPNPDLLSRAALSGLKDPTLAAGASDLFQIALTGARRMVPSTITAEDLEVATEFCRCFTASGRSLADFSRPSG